jgi:hypothetical protein
MLIKTAQQLLTTMPLIIGTRELVLLGILRVLQEDGKTLGPGLGCRATLDRWEKKGTFPLRLGDRTAQQEKCQWMRDEIADWLDCKLTGRKYIQKPRARPKFVQKPRPQRKPELRVI